MTYCYQSAVGGMRYYVGMKGKGNAGCLGLFFTDKSCTNGVGPVLLNLGPTGSSTWQDTVTGAVVSPTGTQSIQIQCTSNGGSGAIDQLYLNQGSSTGFADAPSCSQQSIRDLIPGAGFDSAAALANWNTSAGGTTWNDSEDAQACASSGSVSLATDRSIILCYDAATAGATYYLGMKGKGNVGCVGLFHADKTCTNGIGPDFLNLSPTGSSTWQDTVTGGVVSPAGTQSIQIQCTANGGPGAIDQIFLNQGSATGFGG